MSTHRGQGRILLVDGNWMFRPWAAAVLTRAGYEVVEAESVREAFNVMASEEGRFDGIVSEVFFKNEMSGAAMVKALGEQYGALKVIFTSGYDEATLKDSLGEYGVVCKPCREHELVAKVRRAF